MPQNVSHLVSAPLACLHASLLLARTAIPVQIWKEGGGAADFGTQIKRRKGAQADAHAHARTQAAHTDHKHAHGTQTQYSIPNTACRLRLTGQTAGPSFLPLLCFLFLRETKRRKRNSRNTVAPTRTFRRLSSEPLKGRKKAEQDFPGVSATPSHPMPMPGRQIWVRPNPNRAEREIALGELTCGAAAIDPLAPSSTLDFILETDVGTREGVGSFSRATPLIWCGGLLH